MLKERIKASIPNICTMINACCGVLAILIVAIYKSNEAITIACIAIIVGGFFDGIDGKLARKLNVTCEFGKQLDSFADFTTFVIAPMVSYMVLHAKMHDITILQIAIAVFYVGCGMYRLARYNVASPKGYFEGLPTTATGGIMSLYILASNIHVQKLSGMLLSDFVSFAIIVTVSVLMVSKIRVKRV